MSSTLHFEDESVRPALERVGLRGYDDFVDCKTGAVMSQSESSCTRLLSTSVGDVFLKVYRYRGRHARSSMRRDKSAVEARNYRLLRDACKIAVPHVICWGNRRTLFRLQDGFIVTRAVAGAESLESVAKAEQRGEAYSTHSVRRELMNDIAAMVRRMHDAGFFHVDLQWRNLLVAQDGESRSRIFVLDAARGGPRSLGIRREHGRLRDLAGLAKCAVIHLSPRERIRWLHHYWARRKLGPVDRLVISTIERDLALKDNTHQV